MRKSVVLLQIALVLILVGCASVVPKQRYFEQSSLGNEHVEYSSDFYILDTVSVTGFCVYYGSYSSTESYSNPTAKYHSRPVFVTYDSLFDETAKISDEKLSYYYSSFGKKGFVLSPIHMYELISIGNSDLYGELYDESIYDIYKLYSENEFSNIFKLDSNDNVLFKETEELFYPMFLKHNLTMKFARVFVIKDDGQGFLMNYVPIFENQILEDFFPNNWYRGNTSN